jgi:NADH-quinone oxidoreductase subunit L
VGKSAQIPLYVWLPDAMAGPTPVSALIHAATMVTGGVYLVARSSVLFALAPVSSITVAGIGALTALFAATIALVQTDIKKVLAYSTVSQLGYMFIGVGVGAYAAGVFHLMTHAFFKALLFLGSGAVIHAMHHAFHATHSHRDAQDMRNMGGLRRYMPITFCHDVDRHARDLRGLAVRRLLLEGRDHLDDGGARGRPFEVWFRVFWIMAFAAALHDGVLHDAPHDHDVPRREPDGREGAVTPARGAPVMWVPLAVLAVLSVVGGWINVPEPIAHMPVLGWLPSLGMAAPLAAPGDGAADYIFAANVGELLHTRRRSAAARRSGRRCRSCSRPRSLIADGLYPAAAPVRPAEQAIPAARLRRCCTTSGTSTRLRRGDRAADLALSRGFWRFIDNGLIDGTVNGVGHASRAFGWVGSRLQTGQLNTYAFAAVLGALLLLAIVVSERVRSTCSNRSDTPAGS